MKLLFVEDDDDKAQKVIGEINNIDGGIELFREKSFASALRFLVKNSNIDGVILDMSMPNYDNSKEAPEHFAGRDLLRQCKLRKITKPTFVVTMLDSFGSGNAQINIQQLDSELSEEFSPIYLGIVYYSSAQESWKPQLAKLINGIRDYNNEYINIR